MNVLGPTCPHHCGGGGEDRYRRTLPHADWCPIRIQRDHERAAWRAAQAVQQTAREAADQAARDRFYTTEGLIVGLDEVSDNRWLVRTENGSEHTVRFRQHLDELGCLYFTWQCDCPYPDCRHVDYVADHTAAVDDQAAERLC